MEISQCLEENLFQEVYDMVDYSSKYNLTSYYP